MDYTDLKARLGMVHSDIERPTIAEALAAIEALEIERAALVAELRKYAKWMMECPPITLAELETDNDRA